MKPFLKYTAVLFLSIAASCSTVRYVPVVEKEYVHVHDTTYFKDTTILYKIERERYTDYADLMDTLRLSTDYARAEAYIDTTANKLKGTIESRPEKEIQIQWKERIVYRDSIVYQEKPYPVEVEKIIYKQNFMQKLMTWIGILTLAFVLVKVLLKSLAGKQLNVFGRIVRL